jgi:hypothetical protein
VGRADRAGQGRAGQGRDGKLSHAPSWIHDPRAARLAEARDDQVVDSLAKPRQLTSKNSEEGGMAAAWVRRCAQRLRSRSSAAQYFPLRAWHFFVH